MKKYLLVVVLSFCISHVILAKDGEKLKINKLVDQLQPYVYVITSSKVNGDSVQEMLRDYAIRVNRVEEEEFSIKNYEYPGDDETYGQYGLARVDQVLDDIMGIYEQYNDHSSGEKPAEARKVVKKVLKQLQGAGVLMGYTSDGGAVCGITFTSPLIIDMKNKTIYELILVGSGGEC